MTTAGAEGALARTPLFSLNTALNARMVPFAGYDMPLQFEGIVAEHLWTRASAGLFDVSHMGQVTFTGDSHESVASALERLVPGDILGLKPGRMRYTQLTNEGGGIIDDLMVTRLETDGELLAVVNAGRKAEVLPWLEANLKGAATVQLHADRALIALQGPKAEAVLAGLVPACRDLFFMEAMRADWGGVPLTVSRSGYTGEDGFEVSVPAAHAQAFAERLLAHPEVKPVGLGARDSLRLEAGLCLYGHDIDETTSPVEAALTWSIGARRRSGGGFAGEARIRRELAEGPVRRRVGLGFEGRAIAREGAVILAAGAETGKVTSGGFGPSLGKPVAMGYVARPDAEAGTPLEVSVRGTNLPASVVHMPFVPARYRRRG
jgi:aminomethyltransferase